MPIRRPADLFAGKGSVASKLKKRRKAIEGGDASGKSSKKSTGGKDDENVKAIKAKRAARKKAAAAKAAKARKAAAKKKALARSKMLMKGG